MASNLRKFERTFVFCEFVCQHYKIGYRTSAANFFPAVTLSRYGDAHEGKNDRFRTRSHSRSRV